MTSVRANKIILKKGSNYKCGAFWKSETIIINSLLHLNCFWNVDAFPPESYMTNFSKTHFELNLF